MYGAQAHMSPNMYNNSKTMQTGILRHPQLPLPMNPQAGINNMHQLSNPTMTSIQPKITTREKPLLSPR